MTSRIRQEIKQKRPFRSTGQEALAGLLRTTDRIRTTLERVVAPFGITLQQYNVLRILRGAGENGLPTLEIGVRMIERSPGVTRLIDRLERKRLVRRVRSPDDHRQTLCQLTSAGEALLHELDEPVDKADDRVVSMLSRSQQRTLIDLMDAIREGVR